MTINVKGFVEVASLISPVAGSVSVFGEMSIQSSTYTTELEKYTNASFPGFTFNSFKARNDLGAAFIVPAPVVTSILTLSRFLVTNSVSSAGFAKVALINAITTALPTLSNIDCGSIVSNGTNWMPQWISWTDSAVGTGPTAVVYKVWFSDSDFLVEYDEYSIVVVPPLTALDTLITNTTQAQASLAATKPINVVNAISLAKGNNPETSMQVFETNYIVPGSTVSITTDWYVLIYGIAGTNPDTIKQAIRAYITAHTSLNAQVWNTAFPGIYATTEFVILPRWDKIAIPNLSSITGVYSSVVNAKEATSYAITNIPDYAPTQITNYLDIMSSSYKSLNLLVVGGATNIDSKFRLADYYSDIINVSTSSTDFARMSTLSQGLILLLTQMLQIAETLTVSTALPTNIKRVVRSNKTYLAADYNSIQYLVSVKANVS